MLVSALTGEGLDRLAAEIERRLAQRRATLHLVLDAADGAGLSWLHRHTEVIAKSLREDGRIALTVRADPANVEKARAKFGVVAGFDSPARFIVGWVDPGLEPGETQQLTRVPGPNVGSRESSTQPTEATEPGLYFFFAAAGARRQ